MKGFKNNNGNVKQLRPGSSAMPEDAKAELLRLRNEITQIVDKDPAKAASLLTQWLNSVSKNPANSRKKAG